jgi:AraC-like DNA-binding protein
MDIISQYHCRMNPRKRALASPDLLSRQVTETAYFFLNLPAPGRSGYAISAGGRERCNPDYVVRRRKYGYTVLECVVAGEGHVTLDGIKFPLTPGSVFAYRPDTACEIHTDPVRRLTKYFICLSGRDAPRRLARAGVAPARAARLPNQVEIQSILAQLVREGQARTKSSAAVCQLLFEVLLLKIRESLSRRARTPTARFARFTRVKQLIDTGAERLNSLRDIAREAEVTPVEACKLFHQHLGLSPFRYLMRRKMEIAAEHLVRGDALVKEAAARVGFRDPCHFSRRFKLNYGVSPTRLRDLRNTPSW